MTLVEPIHDAPLDRAVDKAINIGLLIMLVAVCLQILLPFLTVIAWGIIVAVAAYPIFRKLKAAVGGRNVLSATIFTVALLAAFILPAILLTGTLVDGIQTVSSRAREGNITIPPPPPSIRAWPVIGAPLSDVWKLASTNLTALLARFAPQIKAILPRLLSASAEMGYAMLQLVLSILTAGMLLASAEAGARVAARLAQRLFDDRGPEFEHLTGSTIRSVTTGIIGVAFIQTVFAGLGFLLVGLPGAGLWAMIFLFGAILQVGALLFIPAVIYIFATASTTTAVVFLVWCVIVALMDNVLKPLLLGRGVEVPVVVVFLGAIGGFVFMGLIGLFIGPIVLSVGYKLFLAWLGDTTDANQTA
jgi:predicted PurR-regulated permease PerM